MLLHRLINQDISPPGKIFNIDGIKLHAFRSGPEKSVNSSPTIVLEAGCGCSGVIFSWLQKKLATRFSVVSYDRAGLGWSGSSMSKRNAEQISAQLHTLLKKMDVNGPIILVGHSIAGLYLRVYIKNYPQNIVGLVLLDSSHPRQYESLKKKGYTLPQRLKKYLMAAYVSLGLDKIWYPEWEMEASSMTDLPYQARQQQQNFLRCRQTYLTPVIELDSFDDVSKQTIAAGDLGHLPLCIMVAPNPDIEVCNWDEHISRWLTLQHDLLNLSSNSQIHIIKGAGHCTLLTKQVYADQVAVKIFQFIKLIQDKYCSTERN